MGDLSLFHLEQGCVFEGFPYILVVFTKVFHAFRLAFRASVVGPRNRVGLRISHAGIFMHAHSGHDWRSPGNSSLGILAAPRFCSVCNLVAMDWRTTTDHDFRPSSNSYRGCDLAVGLPDAWQFDCTPGCSFMSVIEIRTNRYFHFGWSVRTFCPCLSSRFAFWHTFSRMAIRVGNHHCNCSLAILRMLID